MPSPLNGLLASLAIRSSTDNAGATSGKAPKTGKANAAAEQHEIVRLYTFSVALQKRYRSNDVDLYSVLIGHGPQGVFHARPHTERQLASH